jgi:hypothetical protein
VSFFVPQTLFFNKWWLGTVISIKASLLPGTDLSRAVLSDEIEIEFENKQISKIGAFPLEKSIDFENDITIDFSFPKDASISTDVLDAQFIEY